MSACARDIAKFFAGFAANEAIGHWFLGIWGAHLFPMKFFGITFTQEFNWFAMGFWPLALFLCAYLGWRRRGSEDRGAIENTSARATTASV